MRATSSPRRAVQKALEFTTRIATKRSVHQRYRVRLRSTPINTQTIFLFFSSTIAFWSVCIQSTRHTDSRAYQLSYVLDAVYFSNFDGRFRTLFFSPLVNRKTERRLRIVFTSFASSRFYRLAGTRVVKFARKNNNNKHCTLVHVFVLYTSRTYNNRYRL